MKIGYYDSPLTGTIKVEIMGTLTPTGSLVVRHFLPMRNVFGKPYIAYESPLFVEPKDVTGIHYERIGDENE